MQVVHAVYENGVFRPTVPVDLPEQCEVEFAPTVVEKTADIHADQSHRPQFGSAAGLIHMSEDFDAPLADFQEYME